MDKRIVLAGGRLAFGLLTFAALATSYVDVTGRRGIEPIVWFGFFTNWSNIFSLVVLIAGALYLFVKRLPTERDDIIRGSAVSAIAVVGIVFGVLLSGIENPEMIGWVNVVVHYAIPVAMVLDWLIQPPRVTLVARHLWYWLIFPFVYLIYSLIRGASTGWYPYWFVDPNRSPGGWTGVALFSLAILVLFLIVSFGLLTLGNKGKARSARRTLRG